MYSIRKLLCTELLNFSIITEVVSKVFIFFGGFLFIYYAFTILHPYIMCNGLKNLHKTTVRLKKQTRFPYL